MLFPMIRRGDLPADWVAGARRLPSEGHFEGVAQEPHEGTTGGEGRGDAVQIPLAENVPLRQFFEADEVRPLEILNPTMVGRKAAGRTFETAALQIKALAELLVVPRPLPGARPLPNRQPDVTQRFGIRPPHAHRQKTLIRRDVDVEARGVDVAALFVPELDTDVRLVGAPSLTNRVSR